MELTWIDDFIALDQTRNFTKAAERRFTTQSAFSRRIKVMEEWMGVNLFTRDTRPVELTRAGESCKKRLYRLREDIMDMKRIASLVPSNMPDNTPVIYTTNTIAIGFLPEWIKGSDIKNYRLIVSSVTQALEAVTTGQADYSILPRFHEGDHHHQSIGQDALVYLGQGRIENNIIMDDVIMYAPKTILGQAVEAMMNNHHLTLKNNPICESASAEAVLAQIKNGLGSGWVVKSLLSKSDHKMINTSIPSIPFDICLIRAHSIE